MIINIILFDGLKTFLSQKYYLPQKTNPQSNGSKLFYFE
ncbi:hypothetical protein [Escherichia coli IS1]|uniref:Uncharacterized protein n=3 Tax=Enterobacteriaceae TaxID=543 RepID=A0A5B8KEP9_9ENTR|nr:hypothetical protein pKpNDM1_00469 [Raoultella planticola]AKJ19186.1 hypothetical protein [Enterobacter cloacae]QDY98015.1 Hypothetical protein [Leclercia adecarboxylata]CDK48004.1 hypothetical protein [Escherichia coli IS1]